MPALPSDLAILNGPYLSDILFQPQALTDTLAGLRAIELLPQLPPYSRIILTGMGGSLHAFQPLQIHLTRAGHTAVIIETAELLHTQPGLLTKNSLVIIASQSGRSAEILALLDRLAARAAADRPFTLAVTNTPDAPLAAKADFVLPTRAGPEHSVSCKTFTCTLLALEHLAALLCGHDLREVTSELEKASGAAAGYLVHLETHVRELMAEFKSVRHLFVTGRGASLATVGTGGLILKESTHTHAEGMSCPAFRHGPFEMISSALYALILEGDATTAPLNHKLAADITAATGRAAIIGTTSRLRTFTIPAVPSRIRPILEMLPIQMLSLALAANANRQPGHFERITKVTDSE